MTYSSPKSSTLKARNMQFQARADERPLELGKWRKLNEFEPFFWNSNECEHDWKDLWKRSKVVVDARQQCSMEYIKRVDSVEFLFLYVLPWSSQLSRVEEFQNFLIVQSCSVWEFQWKQQSSLLSYLMPTELAVASELDKRQIYDSVIVWKPNLINQKCDELNNQGSKKENYMLLSARLRRDLNSLFFWIQFIQSHNNPGSLLNCTRAASVDVNTATPHLQWEVKRWWKLLFFVHMQISESHIFLAEWNMKYIEYLIQNNIDWWIGSKSCKKWKWWKYFCRSFSIPRRFARWTAALWHEKISKLLN